MANTLREHQLAMLRMLRVLDQVCRKYNISYQLFAGSALGAVRHRGFIPWDDDLDIVMLRTEYQRFLELAPQEVGEAYFVQSEFSEHWPCAFSKLRMNGTTCIERTIPKDPMTHQGIYIDIFPCDNLSDHAFARRMQFAASKVVIARALDSRGYLTDSKLKKAAMRLARHLPTKSLYQLTIDAKHDASEYVHTFFGASHSYHKAIYPRQWFEESTNLPFEDGTYPVSAHYHELLTTLYGSYMQLPDEKDRAVKVHAELVDLEHSYEQYVGIQNNMTFEVATRSIR